MGMRGLCSRREADKYIEEGAVLVDGVIVDKLGSKVRESARIELKERAQKRQKSLITLALNKSVGYLSNIPEPGKNYPFADKLITKERCTHPIQKVPPLHSLHVAGRLDIDSMGLLIMTQDGRVARALIGEERGEKEYHVDVEGTITEKILEKLRFGIEFDGKPLKRAGIEQIGKGRLKFILSEGKKRQIRWMCEVVGLDVKRLLRVRIGNYQLGGLKSGMWKVLSPEEIKSLCQN